MSLEQKLTPRDVGRCAPNPLPPQAILVQVAGEELTPPMGPSVSATQLSSLRSTVTQKMGEWTVLCYCPKQNETPPLLLCVGLLHFLLLPLCYGCLSFLPHNNRTMNQFKRGKLSVGIKLNCFIFYFLKKEANHANCNFNNLFLM